MTMETRSPGPLRVGYLALTDAAPLIVAEKHGLFQRQGIEVRLSREVGWATIREKIILGELDAAQAPAPMLWAIHLGLRSPACPVLTGFVMSLNGNAVTLSRDLQPEPGEEFSLPAAAARRASGRTLTFGVVFRHSAQQLLLCDWLRRQKLDPTVDARIIVVPPAQMVRNLEARTIDGFAAGEPWNTIAVQRGLGWCPTWTTAVRPDQIEKVLLASRSFADARPSDHAALISALAEAAAWCEESAHREELADLLAERAYLNVPRAAIAPSLLGTFDTGQGVREVPRFHVFHGQDANRPAAERGMELQTQLIGEGLVPRNTAVAKSLFRSDLYDSALAAMNRAHS